MTGENEWPLGIDLQEAIEGAGNVGVGQFICGISLRRVARDGLQGSLPVARSKDGAAAVEYAGLEAQHGLIDASPWLTVGFEACVVHNGSQVGCRVYEENRGARRGSTRVTGRDIICVAGHARISGPARGLSIARGRQ